MNPRPDRSANDVPTGCGRVRKWAHPTAGPTDLLYEEPENSFVAQSSARIHPREGVGPRDKGAPALVETGRRGLIEAKPINVQHAPGERTRVSIRPERVNPQGNGMQEGATHLKAEVLEFVYMGRHPSATRLRVAGTPENSYHQDTKRTRYKVL